MKRLGARLASAGGDFVGKTMLSGHPAGKRYIGQWPWPDR